MFPPINIDSSYIDFVRHPTRNKRIKVLAKIDGISWYDISQFVQKINTNNKIQLLEDPAIDNAKITVKNENNAFTKTQYNDIFDPNVGKLNGTVSDDYLNKPWEVQIILEVYKTSTDKIEIPLFTGIKPESGITEKHKKAEIEIKDILYYAVNKELDYPLLYPANTPDNILSNLLTRAGLDSSIFNLQSLTKPFEAFITEENSTVWRNLLKVVKGTQGRISTTPEGEIIYRTRSENFYDPDIAVTIDENKIQEYELQGEQKYNKIKVDSEGYGIDSSITKIINTTLSNDENRTIKPGDTGTFELEYISDFAMDIESTIFLSYSSNTTVGIAYDNAFSAGDSDSNIRLVRLDRYPDRLVFEVENLNTSIDILIDAVKLNGRQINKISMDKLIKANNTSNPDKEYSIQSFYGEKAMLSNIADVAESNINKDIIFELALNEFYPELYAGNLIELNLPSKGISNGTFIINSVNHKVEGSLYKTNISITEWKNISFSVSDKTYFKNTTGVVPTDDSRLDFIQGEVEELKTDTNELQQKTNFLDNADPDKPANFALVTQFLNNKSLLKMSCDSNTENDILGYEFQWSYDQINWNSIMTKDNVANAEVVGNVEVYGRVRALDLEGNKSLFTDIKTITTAKDDTPPAKPVIKEINPIYNAVVIYLEENTEIDFKQFSYVMDTEEIFFEGNKVRIELEAGITKTIDIYAYDTSENKSEATSTTIQSMNLSEAEKDFDDLRQAVKERPFPEGTIESWSDSIVGDFDGWKPISFKTYRDKDYLDMVMANTEGKIETMVARLNSDPDATDQYSVFQQLSDMINLRVVAVDENGDKTPTQLSVQNGLIQIVSSMFRVLGDAIVEGTITADKLSSLILEAGKYIQVGTTDNGYRLTGDGGLSRLINNENKPIPSIMKTGTVNFNNGSVAENVTLDYPLEKYGVILTERSYKYWDDGFQTQQKRYLNKYITNDNSSGFTINCYTEVDNTIIQINNSISLISDTGWVTAYSSTNMKEITIEIFGNTYTKSYSSTGNYTIQYRFTNTALGPPTFERKYKLEVNWGDGTSSVYKTTIVPSEVTTEMYYRELWFSGVDTINLTGYSDAKGLKKLVASVGSGDLYPNNYALNNNHKITIDSYGTYEAEVKLFDGTTLIGEVYGNGGYDGSKYFIKVDKTEIVVDNPGTTLRLVNKKTGVTQQSTDATIEYTVIGY